MGILRCQVDRFWTDDLPRDHIVNVLHFRDSDSGDGLLEALGFLPSVAVDWNATAADWATKIANAFAATNTAIPTGMGTTIKLYDLHDPLPRPVLGEATIPASGTQASSGNRDVALCLSYYGTRNLARQRGRMYLGPLNPSAAGSLRPQTATMTWALSIPAVLGGLQAQVPSPGSNSDVDWVVYSRVSNTSWKITNAWVDNEWDTQRRRGLRSTVRQSVAVTP